MNRATAARRALIAAQGAAKRDADEQTSTAAAQVAAELAPHKEEMAAEWNLARAEYAATVKQADDVLAARINAARAAYRAVADPLNECLGDFCRGEWAVRDKKIAAARKQYREALASRRRRRGRKTA